MRHSHSDPFSAATHFTEVDHARDRDPEEGRPPDAGGPPRRNLRIPGFTYDGGYAVVGHASGTSIESEDTLRFSALTGVKPMIEAIPLERAPEAYERMMKGDARFHMVLSMAS